jgi:hypothetical protein
MTPSLWLLTTRNPGFEFLVRHVGDADSGFSLAFGDASRFRDLTLRQLLDGAVQCADPVR